MIFVFLSRGFVRSFGKMLVSCSTSNPTGVCLPTEKLERPWRFDIICQHLLVFQEKYNLSYLQLQAIQRVLPIVYSWDKQYNCARESFNRRFNAFPLGIIFCRKNPDVQLALQFVKMYSFRFSIRSSGHNYWNWSVSTQIVIDLSHMSKIRIQPPCEESKNLASEIRGDRFIDIQPGAPLGLVLEKLSEYNLIFPTGSCRTVSISMALGGGISPNLGRKSGLVCDHLHSARILLASGDIVTAKADNEHTSLYWALRGAGGCNFGICLSYRMLGCPFHGAVLFRFTFSWEVAAFVLQRWSETAPFCNKNLSSEFTLRSPRFSTFDCAEVKGQFEGTLDEFLLELDSSFAWLLDVEKKILLREVQFVPTVKEAAEFWGQTTQSYFYIQSVFWKGSIGPKMASVYQHWIERAPGPMDSVSWNALRGQIAQIKPIETAFPWRKSTMWNTFNGFTLTQSSLPRHQRWVQKLYQTILDLAQDNVTVPYLKQQTKRESTPIGMSYVNVPNPLLQNANQFLVAYYGINSKKLQQIKTQYDPKNLFCFPQSIPPTSPKQ